MPAPHRNFAITLILVATACGAPGPEQSAAPAEMPMEVASGRERGFVVGMRPLAAGPLPEQRARMVAQVVRVSNGPGSAAGTIEVVVRLDRGRDVTLVQGAEAGLRLGQRVTVTEGARPRLVRDGS